MNKADAINAGPSKDNSISTVKVAQFTTTEGGSDRMQFTGSNGVTFLT